MGTILRLQFKYIPYPIKISNNYLGSTLKSVLVKYIELIDDRYVDGLSFRSLLPPNFFESTALCGKNSGAKANATLLHDNSILSATISIYFYFLQALIMN
jgi:hypothetical protein